MILAPNSTYFELLFFTLQISTDNCLSVHDSMDICLANQFKARTGLPQNQGKLSSIEDTEQIAPFGFLRRQSKIAFPCGDQASTNCAAM
jgi:hypothetical protein